ncbi:MAG: ferredoxin--NADP+ reductase [Myxococcota bacterium]|jgi:ferredoxin--NADP+ reductase
MQNETSAQPHSVAIVGAAVSGAEVAGRLADRGINVAVFDQNPRPFGKIEDGLPRWHHKLRDKEYLTIRDKLSHPNIQFVPNTVVGKDIDFAALCNDWGFSAVVLANGAWRDRPLAIEGAEACVGKGLVYQNPLVTWWNHLEEQGSDPNAFEIEDNTIVLGGGLASIDVAKIVMLETTRAKLSERGIDVDVVTLEVKGIPKILDTHGLAFQDLGLKGCTIYYRRRLEDMPVVTIPEDATPERAAKARKSRGTLLDKAMRKYCFSVEELAVADSLIMDGDKLAGLVFRKTTLVDGRVVTTDETFERRASCVISSIGSIPEPIAGITMTGELYDFADWDTGRLDDYPTVFSVGNVVTGKGNIVASRKHAEHVTTDAIEAFLGVAENEDPVMTDAAGDGAAAQTASDVIEHLASIQAPNTEARQATLDRVSARQAAVDYPGSLEAWLKSVAPTPR